MRYVSFRFFLFFPIHRVFRLWSNLGSSPGGIYIKRDIVGRHSGEYDYIERLVKSDVSFPAHVNEAQYLSIERVIALNFMKPSATENSKYLFHLDHSNSVL